MKRILILLLIMSLIGCVTKTDVTIQSNTPDAGVYINGDYIGHTQGTRGDASLVTRIANKSNTVIKLVKDGYHSVTHLATTELKVTNLVGGLFLLFIPYAWLIGPKSLQIVDMTEQARPLLNW